MAASLGTLCSALPAFLTGALSVQIRDDLGLRLSDIGIIIASSFAVAGTLSPILGRVAQTIGPQRAFRIGLSATATTMIGVAVFGRSLVSLSLLLAFAGMANAINQPSANLLLSSRIRPGRLGLALALKQSGMPAAALLGGAAVPLIALTVGWRWAFVAAAVLAVIAIAIQPNLSPDLVSVKQASPKPASPQQAMPETRASTAQDTPQSGPDMTTSLLLLYAAVGFLGATAATMVANLLTSAATETGIDPGLAGWLLSIGSATGIASRMYHGWAADQNRVLPIQRVAWLFAIGAGGLAAMTLHTSTGYIVAVVPFFAAGWAWPGLFNLSVIRNNPTAPASATGISQTGVFIGAGAGPLLGGFIAQAWGYPTVWVVGGGALATASILALYLRTRVVAARRNQAVL